RGDVERGDEVRGQLSRVAAAVAIDAPGMVLDVVGFHRVVRHALLALVGPRVRGLYAVRGVVGEGERDRAGRGNGEEVAVAHTVGANLLFEAAGQARSETRRREIALRVEQRKRAFLLRQLQRCAVG